MTSRLKTAATGTTDGSAKPIVSLASHGKRRWAPRGSYLAGAAALLWPCWVRSSSRLGDLYDYSIHIAAARHKLNGESQVPGLPPRIIERLRSSPYQWIIMSKMWSIQIPRPVLTYIQAAYEVERSDEYLIVCRRRPESVLP